MQTPKISNTDTRTNFNGTFKSFYNALSPATKKYVDEARPAIDKMIHKEPFNLYMIEHIKGENTIIEFLARTPKFSYKENRASAYTSNTGEEVAKLYEATAKHAITDYKKQYLHKDNWFIRLVNKLTKYFN